MALPPPPTPSVWSVTPVHMWVDSVTDFFSQAKSAPERSRSLWANHGHDGVGHDLLEPGVEPDMAWVRRAIKEARQPNTQGKACPPNLTARATRR